MLEPFCTALGNEKKNSEVTEENNKGQTSCTLTILVLTGYAQEGTEQQAAPA